MTKRTQSNLVQHTFSYHPLQLFKIRQYAKDQGLPYAVVNREIVDAGLARYEASLPRKKLKALKKSTKRAKA